jgi:hypothetical protein
VTEVVLGVDMVTRGEVAMVSVAMVLTEEVVEEGIVGAAGVVVLEVAFVVDTSGTFPHIFAKTVQ